MFYIMYIVMGNINVNNNRPRRRVRYTIRKKYALFFRSCGFVSTVWLFLRIFFNRTVVFRPYGFSSSIHPVFSTVRLFFSAVRFFFHLSGFYFIPDFLNRPGTICTYVMEDTPMNKFAKFLEHRDLFFWFAEFDWSKNVRNSWLTCSILLMFSIYWVTIPLYVSKR
jgi:hypothetical protein